LISISILEFQISDCEIRDKALMGELSTHVLDLAAGRPARGMRVELRRLLDGDEPLVAAATTNADGRADAPLLAGDALVAGRYRLSFFVGEYFAIAGTSGAGAFLDVVPIEFLVVDAAASYHVPLLVTPWGYSTYRGS
jgi:5-hydroxyisourate hydrolase